jgi:hypothetical protein
MIDLIMKLSAFDATVALLSVGLYAVGLAGMVLTGAEDESKAEDTGRGCGE